MTVPLILCSDFLVDLITALLFVRQGYIKLTPFSSRYLPIGSRADEHVFFTRRCVFGDSIPHVFRLPALIFRKNIGVAASVETLIYDLESRHPIFAAQYFHIDKSSIQIISTRLIIKYKPDFQALDKIASISTLHQTGNANRYRLSGENGIRAAGEKRKNAACGVKRQET
ncbi:hypothetical protein [Burkholderia pyrrocinia]|uniref:hypothetical protein n=1 Tax=Burkholderia pyrrocinia TaxID=60550 RepID=UPI001BCE02CE|nr:hypothetical protein [Burkholderia pyrrocinia]QVN21096.1 hypothetical protein JYG32_31685 [Burkholderia pyrrocinia]